MKNFIYILSLLIIFTAETSSVFNVVLLDFPAQPQPENEKTREFHKQHAYAINRCTQSHEVDIDDVLNTLCHFNIPKMDKFPCWLYCFLEVFGIIKGKNIDWNKAREFTKHRLLEERYEKAVDYLYTTCEEEMKYIPDSLSFCAFAMEYLYCQKRNWGKAGLPLYKKPNTQKP